MTNSIKPLSSNISNNQIPSEMISGQYEREATKKATISRIAETYREIAYSLENEGSLEKLFKMC